MSRKTIEAHSDVKRSSTHGKNNIHLNGKTKPSARSKHSRTYLEEYGTNSTLALSAAAMGLAGAVTYFLLNTNNKKKNNKHLGKYLFDTYQDYKDEAEDIANNVYEKSKHIYDYATDYAENVKDKTSELMEKPASLLLLGATGALVIGGSIAYMLNRKPHASSFIDKFMDSVDNIKESASSFSDNIASQDWVQTLKNVLETIDERSHSREHSSKSSSNFSIQNVIDLGIGGLKLWESISKRK